MTLTRFSRWTARSARLATATLALLVGVAIVACGGGDSGSSTPITGVLQIRPLSAEFTKRKAVNYSPFRSFNRDTEVITWR